MATIQQNIAMASPVAPGGGNLAAALFVEFPAEPFHIGPATDIAAYLADHYTKGSGGQFASIADANGRSGAVAWKRPTIAVGGYTWSVAAAPTWLAEATADVTFTFADGSVLTRKAVRFTSLQRPNARVYAVRPVSGAYIDTGLTMNYGYTLKATGHTTDGGQSVLVGASVSTTSRTTMRLLGGSNKAQCCWPGITEATNAATGINFRRMFSYWQDSDGAYFEQDGVTYDLNYEGTGSGSADAPILLFNETATADYNRGTIAEAEISDAEGNILRHFEPWYWNSELVMLDTANGNQVYRPVKGRLEEVTAE